MSPESIDDQPPTARSDVYSLGVLLFEMLTGRLPFTAETLIRLALMHMNDPPPRPSSIRPEIPAEIDEVVLRALEKAPERRFADGDEFAAALRAVARADELTQSRNTLTPTESPTIPPSADEDTRAPLPRAAVTAVSALPPRAEIGMPDPVPAPRRKIVAERSHSLADAEATRRRTAIMWSLALGALLAVTLWLTLSPPWQTAASTSPVATPTTGLSATPFVRAIPKHRAP